MEAKKISIEVVKLVSHLDSSDLKVEEKIAVLEASAGAYRAIISAEALKLFYQNLFTHK